MKKFILFITLFFLCSCASAPSTLKKGADGRIHLDIQIDGAATPYYAPLYVAQEKGYFKEQGLDVNFYYAPASEIVKNVGAGNVPLGFPNADTVLLGRGNNVPVKIIHTTYQKGLGAIIFKRSHGIKTAKDLKGKTIAITSYGSPNYIQLKVILQENGIQLEDVHIKVIGTGAIVNALISNQVDAICFSKLRTYELRSSGVDVDQILSNSYMPSYGNVVITSDKFLKSNKQVCINFTKALNKSLTYITQNHVKEAIDIARDKYTPSIAGSEQKYIAIMQQEFVKDLWVSKDTFIHGFGYSNATDYQKYITILQANGLFKKSFPANQLMINLGDKK